MVSFIIPYCTYSSKDPINLSLWKDTDDDKIYKATLAAINNINKVHEFQKEIIIVDNSNTFPQVVLPNVKVVKGWQYLPVEEIKKQKNFDKYDIDNFNNQTMWASMAYNIGIENAKYDYIVLQHNDIYYHKSGIKDLINELEEDDYEYISIDGKKINLTTYIAHKEILDKFISNYKIKPFDGGYLETKDLDFADCYFFLTRKSFFEDYFVDWFWGDTNHGATLKCLENGLKYKHLGPKHDNPSYKKREKLNTYSLNYSSFITHLKGGFSEHKMSDPLYEDYYNKFMLMFDD